MNISFFCFTITCVCCGLVICEISDERLHFIYNHPNTEAHIRELVERYIMAKRYQKCMDHFASRLVCQNNTTWFMWAQLLARDIMEGKY